MIVLFSLFLLLLNTSLCLADAVLPRAFLGCSLVLNAIYCYGGMDGTVNDGKYINYVHTTSDLFSLDMTTFDFNGNASSAQTNWTTITNAVNMKALSPLSYHVTTAIAGQSKFLVYGGFSESTISNPIMIYDPPTRTWSFVSSYGNCSQSGAIVDLGGTQTFWTFGGYIGGLVTPNTAYLFNYGKSQWSTVAGDTKNTNVRYSYTATLGNNNRIYLIGGFENTADSKYAVGGVNMLQVRWYDTTNQSWGTDIATANAGLVSQRAYHTTTQIPGTTKFLVYGGSVWIGEQNNLPNDYAYTYDYISKQYNQLNLGSGGAGKRSGHQAVGYKSYIFILFGFDDKQSLRNDINVLDVSNATNPVWLGTKSGTSSSQSANASTSLTSSSNDNELSTGAIVGIAVAASVVGVCGIAGILFCLYRKKRKGKQFEMEEINQTELLSKTWMDGSDDKKKGSINQDKTVCTDDSPPFQKSACYSLKPSTPMMEDTIKPMSMDVVDYVKPMSRDEESFVKPHSSE
ncbi:uncharacterized protein BX664DRAFT_341529 [Halteromyces radiatus]|uniref:uncharacterized protein n=1 Tax=Halteromyces radiatus TaxID=101107 RepID=UPI002220CC17|nr:uncharacterized protein BX664DRAFT_341529 [Halteromyces radiatus]KAI8079816.1 hypothetical protein BX664DRAFT_341529 [Halteromyces radiatus]